MNWRWRSHELKNGVVVEIGAETEYGSFAEFKQRFQQAKVEHRGFDANLTVKHRTQAGAVMQFTYGGRRLLDGKAMDFASYKAFDGPLLRSETGSGIVKMTHANRTRILDFNEGTIAEIPPSR
jgi:hypothetical protein